MAAVQAEDVRASLMFVDDLNGYHQVWLGSTTTNRNGTVSGCDQLAVGPTNARAGTVDLPMTDVPDLVRVALVAPRGKLRPLLSVGSHLHGLGGSKLVC